MFPFPQGQVQSSNFWALGTREAQPLPKAVNKVLGGLPMLQMFPHSLFHLLWWVYGWEQEVREVRMLCRSS